jgi:uncharacterized membrane protein YfhO
VLHCNFATQEIFIQTEAPNACVVVISQTYYPAWKAYVDGRPTKIWRANYAFQTLEVPVGRHRIRLVYEDKMLLAGAFLSGLGLLASAALWVLVRSRPTPGARQSSSLLQTPVASAKL